MHILIAEDSEFNQEVMNQQLLVLGYTADFASNGVEALKRFGEKQYHILLTDIHMPIMNGYELVNRIRQKEIQSKQKLPIIAITADDISEDSDLFMKAGMDAIISKPIDLNDLKSILERWLPENLSNE